jgi:hypothetical protein
MAHISSHKSWTPPYGWNTAKVGLKHQPINQSIKLSSGTYVEVDIKQIVVVCGVSLITFKYFVHVKWICY